MKELPLAVTYYRVSKGEQVASVPEQRAAILPHFHKKYRVVAEYVDVDKSGSKNTAKRKDFLRMVDDLVAGRPRHGAAILCLDLSRFGRLDTIDGAEQKKALREVGVILDTVIDGTVDWRRSNDRIIDSEKSEGNHALALLIGEKGLAGRIRVTKEGKPNQTTPYGMAKKVTPPLGDPIIVARTQHFRTPKGWKSVFIPGDPEETRAISFMFETFAAEDVSYNELARRLHAAGFACPGIAGVWQGQCVAPMLLNPVYAGGLRIGNNPRGKFFRTPEEVVVWDKHEGIVDKPLWDRVQNKIARVTQSRARPRNKGPYALSGVLHCGNCGRPMYGSRNPDSRVIYRCHRVEVGMSTCGYWIAYEDAILPFILTQCLDMIREEVHKTIARTTSLNGEAMKVVDQVKKLDAKLTQARERFLTAPHEVASGLLATLQTWEQERRDLQAKIDAQKGSKSSRLQEWWERYQREFFEGKPIELLAEKLLAATEFGIREDMTCKQAVRDAGGCTVVKMTIPAAVLREKLKRIEMKVFVWFKKKAKGRGYDLDKIRAQAYVGKQLCYEYAS